MLIVVNRCFSLLGVSERESTSFRARDTETQACPLLPATKVV